MVYRSCEGEDHILVSDILRDDRRARGFHLGIRYKPNTPNIRSDSLKLLRKLKRTSSLYFINFKVINMVEIHISQPLPKQILITSYAWNHPQTIHICVLQNNIFPLQNQWKNNQQSGILGHGHKKTNAIRRPRSRPGSALLFALKNYAGIYKIRRQ